MTPIRLHTIGMPRPQPRPRLGRGGHAYNPPDADAWSLWCSARETSTRFAGRLSSLSPFKW
jgi:hypothetical protein